MRLRHGAVLAGLAFGLMTSATRAQPLEFNYNGTVTLSFSLDSMPIPSSYTPYQTEFDGIPTLVNGNTSEQSLDFVFSIYGGFQVYYDLGYLDFNSSKIFGGTTADPIFSDGTFDGTEVVENQDSGELIIGSGVTSVPLPASAPLFAVAVLAFGVISYGISRKAAVKS